LDKIEVRRMEKEAPSCFGHHGKKGDRCQKCRAGESCKGFTI
jgi:hypothetical protein